MRRLGLFHVVGVLAALAAVGIVGPAQAKPSKAPAVHPSTPPCVAHEEGYKAAGTLVSATLASGEWTLVVNVLKVNHHGTTGPQSFTVPAALVKFHHGVSSTAPPEGSRVKLHGKITELPKRCPTVTPTITIKKADIKKAKK